MATVDSPTIEENVKLDLKKPDSDKDKKDKKKKKKSKKGEFTEEPEEIYDGVPKEESPLKRLFREYYYDKKCFLFAATISALLAGAVCIP